MTNSKTTKRALFSSVISLLLCCAMLIGTTFAWFTDSVTSQNNIIKSGNLDVKLEYATVTEEGEKSNWTEVTNETVIFDKYALWEPGYTEVIYLRVSNVGSLALKYQLGVNIISEEEGTNVNGDSFKLSDYIEFGVVENDTTFATRESAREAVDTGAKLISEGYSKSSSLLPQGEDNKSEEYVTLVVYMPEDVGNEANHNGSDIPEINLGINLLATQLMYEEDSFGDDYDENAGWTGSISQPEQDEKGVFQIGSPEELAWFAQYVNGTLPTTYASRATASGHNAVLTADINLNNLPWTPIGRTITAEEKAEGHHSFDFQFRGNPGKPYALFDGQGHTVYNLNVNTKENAGLFGAAVYAEIKNVNVDGATIKSNHFAGTILAQGYALVENCSVKNATVTCTTELVDGSWNNGDKVGGVVGKISEANTVGSYGVVKCSAENVTVTAYRDAAGILGYAGNYASVTGNTIKNVTVIQDKTHDYKAFATAKEYNINSIVGDSTRSTGVVVDGNSGEATLERGATATSTDDLKNAVAGGATVITLGDATYKLPGTTNNKITLIGNGKTVVDLSYATDQALSGTDVTLENLTVTGANTDYTGLQHVGNVVYNNVVFNNSTNLYGESVTFNDCTFNLTSRYIWTYGAGVATFNNCTFYTEGKAILAYKETDPATYTVNINDCTFYATKAGYTSSGDHCAAVEIDSHLVGAYVINFNGTNTVSTNFADLYRIKDQKAPSNVTINQNGTVVTTDLIPVSEGLYVNTNGVYYITNATGFDAMREKVAGEKAYENDGTWILYNDIDLNGVNWTPIAGFHGIFDGNGKTISNMNASFLAENSIGGRDFGVVCTIKNVTFHKASITGTEGVGVVVSNGVGVTIENVKVTEAAVIGTKYVGGIVGVVNKAVSTITGCSVENSTIKAEGENANGKVGGIVGFLSVGKATGNTVTGCTISGPECVGGIAGRGGSGDGPATIYGNTVSGNTVTGTDTATVGEQIGDKLSVKESE